MEFFSVGSKLEMPRRNLILESALIPVTDIITHMVGW